MAFCQKCETEEPALSDGLCAACDRVFGTASARRRKALDLAYGGYSISGLLSLFVSAWMAGLIDYSTGFVILVAGFPLLMVALAVVIAMALSLKYWRDWPLPVLGAMTVLLVVLHLPTELPVPTAVRIYAAYGLVVLAFSGLWFGAHRWSVC